MRRPARAMPTLPGVPVSALHGMAWHGRARRRVHRTAPQGACMHAWRLRRRGMCRGVYSEDALRCARGSYGLHHTQPCSAVQGVPCMHAAAPCAAVPWPWLPHLPPDASRRLTWIMCHSSNSSNTSSRSARARSPASSQLQYRSSMSRHSAATPHHRRAGKAILYIYIPGCRVAHLQRFYSKGLAHMHWTLA